MNTLINKRILVGVTGGVAAYKSAYLVRRLVEQGAKVEVVMTHGGSKFVTPLTFQALSGGPVHTKLLHHDSEEGMGHIKLARWSDVIIVAPATAHFISKLAHGAADDLLSTICLAADVPVMVAPAMNQQMWENSATKANINTIIKHGMSVLGPDKGDQACGEIGLGRMLEPENIVKSINHHFKSSILSGKAVLITAGPTRESIDPVRYISNHSSGKMGFAVAQAAVEADANVTLITGPVSLEPPDRVNYISVTTASQMQTEVFRKIESSDIFISAAAVSDYRCIQTLEKKIKKSNQSITLELKKNPDIIANVAANKHKPFTVGFAAETEELAGNARKKLRSKGLDMIAANKVGDGLGFGTDQNELQVFWGDESINLGTASKHNLARRLIKLVAHHYHEKNSA